MADIGKKLEQATEPTRGPNFPFVDSIKNILTGKSNSTPSQDTSWHDSQVAAANKSFVNQSNQPTPKTPKTGPAKSKLPKYKDGTDRVPKTGPAILHKDEAVLKKEDADKYREGKMKHKNIPGAEELAGKSEKPAKEIKHIIVKKAKTKDGKHVNVHTHVHTHPEHHPDEEHVTEGNDGLVEHMLEHQGEPNPGEAEADAGQSGIPAGAPAPTPGAPAAGPVGA
jgi:hypothetical protein